MTVLSDLEQIFITPTAKDVCTEKGVDIAWLLSKAEGLVIELYELLNEVIAVHPRADGDAANYTALVALISSIAQPQ